MRPNVNPIAVTTGVGPNGPSTQWIQRPDYFIDPTLLAESLTQTCAPPVSVVGGSPAPLTPPRPFGTDSTNHYEAETPSTSAGTPTSALTAPAPSTTSRQAIDKMKANIRVASKKRTFMDEMLDVTK
jgi:hypothetical protein